MNLQLLYLFSWPYFLTLSPNYQDNLRSLPWVSKSSCPKNFPKVTLYSILGSLIPPFNKARKGISIEGNALSVISKSNHQQPPTSFFSLDILVASSTHCAQNQVHFSSLPLFFLYLSYWNNPSSRLLISLSILNHSHSKLQIQLDFCFSHPLILLLSTDYTQPITFMQRRRMSWYLYFKKYLHTQVFCMSIRSIDNTDDNQELCWAYTTPLFDH